jgi:hypothetical protein
MHISRHPINKDAIISSFENYESLKDNALKLFQTDKTELRALSGYFFNLFCYSTIVGNDIAKRLEWLDLAIAAAVAKYTIAVNIGKRTNVEFMNATYEIDPPAKDYRVTDTDWTRVYLSAIVRRNDKAIDRLAAIDLEEVKRQDVTKGFEYNFLFAQFLQRLFDKGVDNAKNLSRASKASLEVPETSLQYNYMLDIASPQIDLFTYILRRNEEKFNELLLEALECFKEYFEQEGEEGKKDPDGLVSIPLSAIVRLAKDQGMAVHHTSDYLPAWLIDAG